MSEKLIARGLSWLAVIAACFLAGCRLLTVN